MGLDIYLRKCADRIAAKAAEAEFEKLTEGVWADSVTEQERERRINEAMEKCGTDKWGSHPSRIDVDAQPSALNAEHYFKVGYWRSSYNGSGINNVMRKIGLPGLGEIMDVTGEEYEVVPDWDASLARVNDAIARYEAHLSSDAGKFSVYELRPMFDHGVASEQEALAKFVEEVRNPRSDFMGGSYSNADGEYHMDGMKVVGFVTKKFTRPRNAIENLISGPAVFVVYEKEPAEKEDWHLTALKIVRETIEYVLAQPDKQTYYLAWSG